MARTDEDGLEEGSMRTGLLSVIVVAACVGALLAGPAAAQAPGTSAPGP